MCYHPNILVYKENSSIRKDGQLSLQRIKIIFSNEPTFKGYEHYLELDQKSRNEKKYGERIGYKLIPCGKCIQCRKLERYQWTSRIELEAKQYDYNYFLTLTYNEENLYIPDYTVNKKTGEIFKNDGSWTGSLNKKDLQQFIKSLRTYFKRDFDHDGVKFYACGEYGDIGDRPHYHIILMNTPPLEQKLVPQTKNILTNDRITDIWHKGFTSIGECNWTTIGYTAGYCQKKLFGDYKDEYYAKKGQEPIFANMSRRPGIGRAYYEEHKDEIYELDEIINSKGNSMRPPAYFDRLMDIGEKDVIDNIKNIRDINAYNKTKKKLSKTDLSLKEQYEIEERTAIEKFKKYRKKGKFINESLYT